MPRLFTGIEIPANLQMRLSMLGAPLAGARWIKPENLHLTLCFAGDIDKRVADDWAAQLAELESETFEITITGLYVFGSRQQRSIWAGVSAGEQLAQLHNAHLRAARAAGITCDERRFHPHITLARLHNSNASAIADYLSAQNALDFGSFVVERVALFSARPGRGGGPYAVEDSYPLQQPIKTDFAGGQEQ